jgi:predicted transcriptional regulator
MVDKEIWAEALNLAKDQLRHGKVHFSELEVVTKSIYEKLDSLRCGPVIDITAEPMKQIEAQRHEKTRKCVKCALCGAEYKTLTKKHLASHGLTREEYMKKFDVKKKDMSVKVARKTTSGEDNPLKQMQMVMKEFGVARGEVKKFVTDKGFDGLKGLAAAAKEKNVSIIELLGGGESAAPAKDEKKK